VDFPWPKDEVLTGISLFQWEFQDPKMEVPTIYKAYVREYPHKIWPYMVQYLHFRILEFPLTIDDMILCVGDIAAMAVCWFESFFSKGCPSDLNPHFFQLAHLQSKSTINPA
jgi:hypothetical protein